MKEARRGDQAAFSRLVEPHRRELLSYCYRLCGSLPEAEDLTQEALLRAFSAMSRFEGRCSPRAWLYQIAHNLCINHARRRPPQWESLSDDAANAQMPETSPEREDLRLGFAALMQTLPARQRAVLVLRDVLGWSAEETARILETTVPAVKNALGRARRTLAQQPFEGDPALVQDRSAADPKARAVLAEWLDAFDKGATPRLAALLTGTVTVRNDSENG